MKKIYILLAISILAGTLYAQQLSLNSQYSFNRFLINPAVAGNQDYIPLRLTARQQWIGIDGAPSIQSISGHTKLAGKNMGIGGYVFIDRFGPETKIGLQISYSYIMNMGFGENTKLALGIAARGVQYKLDYTELKATDYNDALLGPEAESTFVPDADLGVYMYSKTYFVGFSAAQLISMDMNLVNTLNKNALARHFNIMAGYKYKLDESFEIEPSVYVKYTPSAPVNIDINARVIYQDNYWAGLSYRTSNTLSVMVGMQYKNFVFGYAYDYSMSEIKHYQGGSHEIVLGYNISKNITRGSSMM